MSTTYYGTGRRKTSTARVHLSPGSGKITINDRDIEKYFTRPVLRMLINQPFSVTNRAGEFDVVVTVSGGGLSGQAGAVRLGIARALIEFNSELRPKLKELGLLTRDAREHERKKYGQKGARKRFQFSKR